MQPPLLNDFRHYIQDVLGEVVVAGPWAGDNQLPYVLGSNYSFAQTTLLRMPCLLMIDLNQEEQPPTVIGRHLEMLHGKFGGEVIYVRRRITTYNRKRLIEQKVPFVIPGNQMYLPMLGLDLREHFRSLNVEPVRFSPASQVTLIYMLLHRSTDEFSTTELSATLGYTTMTVTRAFDEMAAAKLSEDFMRGRERWLKLLEPKPLVWERALPLLRSPMKKRLYAHGNHAKTGVLAGLSALADYTMIASPANRVLAYSREEWKTLRQQQVIHEVPQPEHGTDEIEIWSYSPAPLTEGEKVDPLSLYLSLRENKDERVAAALEELLRMVKW